MSAASAPAPPPVPPHHRPGGGFQNPWPGSAPGRFSAFLKWTVVDRFTEPRRDDPPRGVFPRVASTFATPRAAPDAVTVTWVGRSTLLAQMGGLNILTDPMWSERASPIQTLGPKRWVEPGIAWASLPPIDIVLQSHNHYDHLDEHTVRRLARRDPDAQWVTTLGVGAFLRSHGVRRVVELDWWEEIETAGAQVGCTPAQHFSSRGIRDRNMTLWCGFAVQAGEHRLLFAGDTAYHPEFGAIARRFGPFDVAMLPVGAYDPRWFMRSVHMDAEEAVRAYGDLRAARASAPRSVMVPIHWGTFKLTDEPMDEPPKRARAAWQRAALPAEDFWLLAHGETRSL